MIYLGLNDVSVKFGKKTILEHVSHNFAPRQVTAILGASGSGKTTLLRVLNGTAATSSGEVYILEQPLPPKNELPALRLRMGYVIQQSGLFPHLTVSKNIALPGKIQRHSEAYLTLRVNQLMELVDLPKDLSGKYPHELSGGQQQRAALCRAMLLNPPILLMDEPFASLDTRTKHGIYNHLQRIQSQEPRTILLVTHDWEEADLLADEFVWVDQGKIRASGKRDQLAATRNEYLENT